MITHGQLLSSDSIIMITGIYNNDIIRISKIQIYMLEFQQQIRKHFNINHLHDSLQFTLINPYLTNESIEELSKYLLSFNVDGVGKPQLRKLEINIIQCSTFDDDMVIALGTALPLSLKQLTLDFTGCESIKGSGLLDLFENISQMQLEKLHLDFSQVYDLNDFVFEGLAMLIQSLTQLKQLYLDFYEIDQVTDDGYMLMAESFANLSQLRNLHLDFSANPNLSEDNLELMFGNLPKTLDRLSFRILDIEQIGGGSFFRLATYLSQCSLKQFNLTISTFSSLNPKSLYSIIKQISNLQSLQQLTLNLSNTNIPNKLIGYLKPPKSIKKLTLDISCNSQVNDTDIVALFNNITNNKLENLKELILNIDFCKLVSEDAILVGMENMVNMVKEKPNKNQQTLNIKLTDKKYSQEFLGELLGVIDDADIGKLMDVEVEGGQVCKKWIGYKQKQCSKKGLMYGITALESSQFKPITSNIISFLAP